MILSNVYLKTKMIIKYCLVLLFFAVSFSLKIYKGGPFKKDFTYGQNYTMPSHNGLTRAYSMTFPTNIVAIATSSVMHVTGFNSTQHEISIHILDNYHIKINLFWWGPIWTLYIGHKN